MAGDGKVELAMMAWTEVLASDIQKKKLSMQTASQDQFGRLLP